MYRLIGIAIVIWIIVRIVEWIGDFLGDISSNRAQAREIREKQKTIRNSLLAKFWERVKWESLDVRNADVINYYANKITASSSVSSIRGLIENCINDISVLEWKRIDDEDFHKNLEEYFNDKVIEEKEIERKQKYLDDLEKQTRYKFEELDERLKKFNNRIDQIESNVNGVSVWEDLNYYNKSKHYISIDSLLKDIIFYNEKKFDKTEEKELLIWDIINKTLREQTWFSIKDYVDGSSLKAIDSVLSKEELKKLTPNELPKDLLKWSKASLSYLQSLYASANKKMVSITKVFNERIPTIKNNLKKLLQEHNNKAQEIINWLQKNSVKAIEEYNTILLMNSEYDNMFDKEFTLEYNNTSKILIIEYMFPDLDNFPDIKEIKISAKGIRKEVKYSASALGQLYDNYISAICIRKIYEICKNDPNNSIDAVSFNWWVDTINKWTWKKESLCIASIQIRKEDIININLRNIDPKTSFRAFKWVCAAKLSSLTPIKPIMTINKKDKRFVEWYDVIDKVDNTTNLASMDWQDFENLIRELFGKIYSKNGWEVKVTQASRDWWIDAVAFDPDPVTWWKIVIQAKRYTNVVWVSAVRDLYWSVHNEWAMKGILVTTSNFWSDAYQFAKDKPLTLLSWNELLYLLQEHGYHAHINIKEAKKELKSKELEWK